MAWQMPTSGPWNPGMPLAPDNNIAIANMGSYTQEQWAAMQHQNWQQWTQWQQQYAQWQSQHGEKFAQQMNAIQSINNMPPLPPANTAPPPAPPPPEQPPPPPPPHENNQPLYGHNSIKPVPVPPPTNQHQHMNMGSNANVKVHQQQQSGANSNWTYPQDTSQSQQSQGSLNAANAEALKKLAEEERLFDIQFKKWEKEIEKWKKDNVNHPDKQAYSEYEQKFETCRVQLMERREQMKLKRARLMSNNTPTAQTSNNTANSNVIANVPPNFNMNQNNYQNNLQPQSGNNSTHNYSEQGHSQFQKQQYNISKQAFNRGNNKVIDPQDRYESYHGMNESNFPLNTNLSVPPVNPSFLPVSVSNKGIPGLDLVPEADKAYPPKSKHDIIDISEDKKQPQHQQQPKAPDYTTISKGINNILGDEKIMNILSMVRGQASQDANHFSNMNVPPPNYNLNNQNNVPYSQDNRNQNQHYDNRENFPLNRQESNYNMQQNQNNNSKFPPQNRMRDNVPSEQFNYDRNVDYGGNNVGPSFDNVPGPRSGPPYVSPNMQHGSNRPPIRPLMQEIAQPSNMGDYSVMPHERKPLIENNMQNIPTPPVRPQWVDEPMFTPSLIVEYEHKPLRLKARDFIEPVHMFDYNHVSKDGEVKNTHFDDELDDFYSKKRRSDKAIDYGRDRYARDHYSRDYERRVTRPQEDLREEIYPRVSSKDEYDDRRRLDNRFDDRRKDDRDKYNRRDDDRGSIGGYRERDREYLRDRNDKDRSRDSRREESRRSRSRERDSRKRASSREMNSSSTLFTKRSRDNDLPGQGSTFEQPKHIVMIDDLLEIPGRSMRPDKIVIILRGIPGSGKSYLAKLIRDREAEFGGTVRIMSIDDYFMQEGEVEEEDPTTGKLIKKPTLKYEYDRSLEETYINSLKRAFRRSLTNGYFTFLIYDAINEHLKSYADIWNYARQNGFQVYVCTMENDPNVCFKRNIHNRTLEDIEVIAARFFLTPAHHIQLDATTLLQSAAITEVHMEDADDQVVMEDAQEPEVESVFTSKWEKMDDVAQLARLDGTSKPLRPSQFSMEDYLQLDDWTPNTAKPGKKTVRWADIEERREQEKMRAIGFVVGQTDWNRMTDPTMGSSALTQTKYIERVRRN